MKTSGNPREHRSRRDRRRSGAAGGPDVGPDRRRRARCVHDRAATARPSAHEALKRRDHAALRRCHPGSARSGPPYGRRERLGVPRWPPGARRYPRLARVPPGPQSRSQPRHQLGVLESSAFQQRSIIADPWRSPSLARPPAGASPAGRTGRTPPPDPAARTRVSRCHSVSASCGRATPGSRPAPPCRPDPARDRLRQRRRRILVIRNARTGALPRHALRARRDERLVPVRTEMRPSRAPPSAGRRRAD